MLASDEENKQDIAFFDEKSLFFGVLTPEMEKNIDKFYKIAKL